MATAPLAAEAAGPDTGQDIDAAPPRDIEAEARHHGWTPKEEFRGDPTRWVDAETFVNRADEVMPLLKKQNQAFKRELEDMKRQFRRASDHFSKVEERATERAIAEIQARQDAAAEVGDVAGVRKATEEIRNLNAGMDKGKPDDAALAIEAREAEIDWREKNPWYDKGGLMTDYANVLVEKHRGEAKNMRPADFYDMIADKVRERYGDKMDAAQADDPPARRRSAVEGVTAGASVRRGQKSFSDLPAQAQQMCDKWVRQGLIKSRDDYVKSYQW